MLGLVFLVLAFWNVRLTHSLDILSRADPWPLVACVFLYAAMLWLRSLRWKLLLRPMGEVPAGRLFPVVAIGYMANNLLPARIGDLIRAWLVGSREDVSKASALATILLERAFDAAATLLLVGLLLPFLVLPASVHQALGLVAVVLVLLVMVAFLVAGRSHQALSALRPMAGWLPSPLQVRAATLMERFLEGLRVLRTPAEAILALAVSLGLWIAAAGIYYAVMLSLGVPASLWAALLVSALVNISAVLPSPPGYVGVFELAAVAGYRLLDVPPDAAAGLAVTTHAMLFFPGVGIGLFCLWRENLSLGLLEQKVTGRDKAAAPTAT